MTKNTRIPVRLVICIDGTWCGPDSVSAAYEGNISNVYRIFSAVKTGTVVDGSGKPWVQKKEYWKGLDSDEPSLKRYVTASTASSCETLMRDVYQYCLENTVNDQDEIYFFGFSRGAYVVRALAGLLHHLGRIAVRSSFKETYEDGLKWYKEKIFPSSSPHASPIDLFFSRQEGKSPRVKYIGIFDTVKATSSDRLHLLTSINVVEHLRHALALNEQRNHLTFDWWVAPNSTSWDSSAYPRKSYQEAWFLGSHGDMGGANAKDGLSLYPLQWILSEAEDCGLVMHEARLLAPLNFIDSTTELVFPAQVTELHGEFPKEIKIENRIRTKHWNLFDVHKQERYSIAFNLGAIGSSFWGTSPRRLFSGNDLIGYRADAAVGAFIHPSVYVLSDVYSFVYIHQRALPFSKQLQNFRVKINVPDDGYFWEGYVELPDQNIQKLRVLVCGEKGVGKSTMINGIFGQEVTPAQKRRHGVHNINKEFSNDSLIVHDSRGFQSGSLTEIETVHNFLKDRAQSKDVSQQLHVIWYCIDSGRVRSLEEADKNFFKCLEDYQVKAAVLLICTKIGRVRREKMGEFDEMVEDEGREPNVGEKASFVEEEVNQQKVEILEDWDSIIKKHITAVLFTEKDSLSIQRVNWSTQSALSDTRIRDLYIASQVCEVDSKIDAAFLKCLELLKIAAFTSAGAELTEGAIAYHIVKKSLESFGYHALDFDKVYNALKKTKSMPLIKLLGLTTTGCFAAAGVLAGDGIVTLGLRSFLAATVGTIGGVVFGILFVAGLGYKMIRNSVSVLEMWMKTTISIILILERAFWLRKSNIICEDDLESAAYVFSEVADSINKHVSDSVGHLNFVKIWQTEKVKTRTLDLIDKYRFRRAGEAI